MSLLKKIRIFQEKQSEESQGRKIKEKNNKDNKNKCNYCKMSNHKEKDCYKNKKAEKNLQTTKQKI